MAKTQKEETAKGEVIEVETTPVEGAKAEVPVVETKKAKGEAKKAEVKERPRTQTIVIQELLRAKKSEPEIIAALIAETGRDEKWARGRFALYARAYGKRGERDKGMADHDGAVVNVAS